MKTNITIQIKLSLGRSQKRMSLIEYFRAFNLDIQKGKRLTGKGTLFAQGSIYSINEAFSQLLDFQTQNKISLKFNDIDLAFYHKYIAFLNSKHLKTNTIGKCISALKYVMANAEQDGIQVNAAYRNRKFKVLREETESIYFTHDELSRIDKLDLSGLNPCYSKARDLFFIGILTAQRISDYNCIKPEGIKTVDGLTTIEIRQKKTGKKVIIPCGGKLMSIIEKYEYGLPHICRQNFGKYIKCLGKMAEISDPVEIFDKRRGEYVFHPKYELIQTHTARRTGATLMYLSGVEIWDIMKITGHSSPEILKRYIRADNLEVARKLSEKYQIFHGTD